MKRRCSQPPCRCTDAVYHAVHHPHSPLQRLAQPNDGVVVVLAREEQRRHLPLLTRAYPTGQIVTHSQRSGGTPPPPPPPAAGSAAASAPWPSPRRASRRATSRSVQSAAAPTRRAPRCTRGPPEMRRAAHHAASLCRVTKHERLRRQEVWCPVRRSDRLTRSLMNPPEEAGQNDNLPQRSPPAGEQPLRR